MIESYDFFKSVIDTIIDHIVVIDSDGNILFVNQAWKEFGSDNACQTGKKWVDVNYLEECDKASDMGDRFGVKAASGIRAVIRGEKERFTLEYPCHSPEEKRWFMMCAARFMLQGKFYYVISHQNITERKLVEEEVLNLSRIDGLTDLPNRRYFNEFLENEWKRCLRFGLPISLAIIDLDHFKLLNDTYGHQAGDECLKSIGGVLKRFSRRPADICARYGGEEFAIIYGGTSLDHAREIILKLLDEIRLLKIPNENSPILPTLTASIGLATMQPKTKNSETDLIDNADKLLYSAKKNGRDQLCFCLGSRTH
jgi:diguanylate cyclase (GGDEF)-like protein